MRRLALVLLVACAWPARAAELIHYTRPAERERGASFADGFESQARVESNGGTVHGSPTFSASQGVTLDGSSDYIQYNLTGQEFNSDPISILIEFTPEFDYDADKNCAIYYGGSYFYILKTKNVSGNKLNVKIHNTFYSILPSSYSSYWKVGERNILIVSSESGSEKIWLNGEEIASASTSYTVQSVTNLYVGSSNTGSALFDGTIHRFVVFHAKLSDAEAEAYSYGTMWNYENRAVAVWRFRAADHTGTTTKESAGRGYDLTINGSPEKLQTHGYEFDGSNDYLSRADDDTFDPAGDFSVQCVMVPDTTGGTMHLASKWYSQTAWKLSVESGNAVVAVDKGGSQSSRTVAVSNHSLPLALTGSYDYVADGSSVLTLYAGFQSAQLTSAVGPVRASTDALGVAAAGDGSDKFDGQILYCAYWNEALNQMQHLDFMIRERRKIQEQ